jgi:hypothetical protein
VAWVGANPYKGGGGGDNPCKGWKGGCSSQYSASGGRGGVAALPTKEGRGKGAQNKISALGVGGD